MEKVEIACPSRAIHLGLDRGCLGFTELLLLVGFGIGGYSARPRVVLLFEGNTVKSHWYI